MNEQEIYSDLVNYINGRIYNRGCVLQSIKKELRTPRIIDLVFSNPQAFHLINEIEHVPEALLTPQVLIKFILSNPRYIAKLSDDELSFPVLMAYEFSKRYAERWTSYNSLDYKVPLKYIAYQYDIVTKYQEINRHIKEDDKGAGALVYYDRVSKELNRYYGLNGFTVIHSHNLIDIMADKKIVVLISGAPGSGKTHFGDLLSSVFAYGASFDSDDLLINDTIGKPLDELVASYAKIIIFSDVDAANFFSEDDLKDKIVINITMHTPHEEVPPVSAPDAIDVLNDFTEQIYGTAAQTVEAIINKIEEHYLGQDNPAGSALKRN